MAERQLSSDGTQPFVARWSFANSAGWVWVVAAVWATVLAILWLYKASGAGPGTTTSARNLDVLLVVGPFLLLAFVVVAVQKTVTFRRRIRSNAIAIRIDPKTITLPGSFERPIPWQAVEQLRMPATAGDMAASLGIHGTVSFWLRVVDPQRYGPKIRPGGAGRFRIEVETDRSPAEIAEAIKRFAGERVPIEIGSRRKQR